MSPVTAEVRETAEVSEKSLLEAAVDETNDRDTQRALGRIRVEMATLEYDRQIARVLHEGNVYKDLKDCTREESIAKAILKIMLGRSMGMSAMESLQSLYLVGGKPSVSSDFRASRMRRAGYSWDFVRHDEKGCVIALSKDGKPIMRTKPDGKTEQVTISFVEADAQAAGLLTRGKGDSPSMYEKWGRLMYFNRCIGYAQRFYAPEVLGPDFASIEDVQFELDGKYKDDGERMAGEVAGELHIKAQPGTREAQEQVAAVKIAAAQQEKPAEAAPKPVMTMGRK